MSNYLRNLAAALVHPGGNVQPRLPGRFEAQHLALSGLQDPVAADEAESGVQSPKSKVQGPEFEVQGPRSKVGGPKSKVQSPRSKVEGPQASSSEGQPLLIEVGTEAQPGHSAPSEGMSPPGPAAPTAFEPSKSTTPGKAALSSQQRRRDAHPSDEVSPARSQSPPSLPADASQQRPASIPQAPAPLRPPALGSDPKAAPRTALSIRPPGQIEPSDLSGESGPPARQPTQAPAAVPLLGQADVSPAAGSPFVEPQAGAPQQQARVEAAPPIRVTIGRVEVRAVMPQAAPPRPQPVRRRPALSLEQYLKQRNEGSR